MQGREQDPYRDFRFVSLDIEDLLRISGFDLADPQQLIRDVLLLRENSHYRRQFTEYQRERIALSVEFFVAFTNPGWFMIKTSTALFDTPHKLFSMQDLARLLGYADIDTSVELDALSAALVELWVSRDLQLAVAQGLVDNLVRLPFGKDDERPDFAGFVFQPSSNWQAEAMGQFRLHLRSNR